MDLHNFDDNNYMYRNIHGKLVPIDYFELLPEYLKNVSLINKKIKFEPNLLRFNNLTTLTLTKCYIKKLPLLPNSIISLYVKDVGLEYLPNLENTNLCYISASENKLTNLPKLPNTLISLFMNNNNLTEILELPTSLNNLELKNNKIRKIQSFPINISVIVISNNFLIELPTIPENTSQFICDNNPLVSMPEIKSNKIWFLHFNCEVHGFFKEFKNYEYFEYFEDDNIDRMIIKINLINKFKSTYYHLLCRSKLRKLLWERIREPKIRELYHPNKLNELINDVSEDELEEKLDEWCK